MKETLEAIWYMSAEEFNAAVLKAIEVILLSTAGIILFCILIYVLVNYAGPPLYSWWRKKYNRYNRWSHARKRIHRMKEQHRRQHF